MPVEHTADTEQNHGNFIAGASAPSEHGELYERRNPARPSEIVGRFAASTTSDVDAAIVAAVTAAPSWADTPAPARGQILAKAARLLEARLERVAEDMTLEMGKPVRESRREVARAVAILDFFAAEGQRAVGEVYEQSSTTGSILTLHRPVGVVGLITPWNFPLAIPVWKAAPALVYGNTIVLKLSVDAPRTGLHLAECLDAAGLPAGALNVLTGDGKTVGGALAADHRIDAVSFTGSVAVGTSVRDIVTTRGARVQLELGGQNPLVVAADARLDVAVEAAYAGAFWSAGQKCTATRRILVESSIYDEFRDRLLTRVAAARIGDPIDPSVEVGPLVSERQLESVLDGIERGRNDGSRVAAGGVRLDREGWFVAPTVFEDVADDAYLSCEEVFGPVTSLYRFADLDEAIDRANAVRFGLSASIFTQGLATSERFIRGVRAGILHVNSQTAGAEAHVPFGGVKGSAYGPHEQGSAAIEFYTQTITVYRDV